MIKESAFELFSSVSPPQIVGLSNGVAQSIVSLARGFGPLLGGYVRALAHSIRGYYNRLTPPSRYGPRQCKGTRRDTTSGSSCLARRARSRSSTASSSANAKRTKYPLVGDVCAAITSSTNDTIWTITRPHHRLFTIFPLPYFMFPRLPSLSSSFVYE